MGSPVIRKIVLLNRLPAEKAGIKKTLSHSKIKLDNFMKRVIYN